MSKGIKRIMNLDKLEICYKTKKENLDAIEENEKINFNGFYLNKIARNDIANYYSINIYDDKFESGQYQLGELKIGNKFENENDEIRYCWIYVYNQNLYINTPFLNYWDCLYGIQQEIGLYFNNFTNLDIAIDANYNFYKKIWNEIRNKETTNIILNRQYSNTKETLKGIEHIFPCNSERLLNGGIYICNKEKDMKLRCYDKTQEILDNSGKTYIQNRFISIKKVFRCEVALKNKSLDEYCEKNEIEQYDIYMQLNNEVLLYNIFNFYSDRLIHFVDSRRNKISILNL